MKKYYKIFKIGYNTLATMHEDPMYRVFLGNVETEEKAKKIIQELRQDYERKDMMFEEKDIFTNEYKKYPQFIYKEVNQNIEFLADTEDALKAIEKFYKVTPIE